MTHAHERTWAHMRAATKINLLKQEFPARFLFLATDAFSLTVLSSSLMVLSYSLTSNIVESTLSNRLFTDSMNASIFLNMAFISFGLVIAARAKERSVEIEPNSPDFAVSLLDSFTFSAFRWNSGLFCWTSSTKDELFIWGSKHSSRFSRDVGQNTPIGCLQSRVSTEAGSLPQA